MMTAGDEFHVEGMEWTPPPSPKWSPQLQQTSIIPSQVEVSSDKNSGHNKLRPDQQSSRFVCCWWGIWLLNGFPLARGNATLVHDSLSQVSSCAGITKTCTEQYTMKIHMSCQWCQNVPNCFKDPMISPQVNLSIRRKVSILQYRVTDFWRF